MLFGLYGSSASHCRHQFFIQKEEEDLAALLPAVETRCGNCNKRHGFLLKQTTYASTPRQQHNIKEYADRLSIAFVVDIE